MERHIQTASEVLLSKGINPSHQRVVIYSYLATHRVHPTADMIYDALRKTLPTLSRSTVYTTLKTFLKAGILRELTIEENEVRYDFDITDHGHFKCESCGEIVDFPINAANLSSDVLPGVLITDRNVFFKGVCARCAGAH